MSENPVAGWYADPAGSTKLRYWDGTQWTEQFTDAPSGADAAATQVADAQPQQAQAVAQPVAQPIIQQQTYGNQPNQAYTYQQAPVADNNGKAVGALVCGLVGLIVFGLVLGIVAIVLGVQGRKIQYRRGMATAGMVIGIIDVVAWAILVIAMAMS